MNNNVNRRRFTDMFAVLVAFFAIAANTVHAAEDNRGMTRVGFKTELCVAYRQFTKDFCWSQARAAVIPASSTGGQPVAIMTLQKYLHSGEHSDYYSGLYTMRSDDLGKTWSKPAAVPSLAWIEEPGGVVVSVCDTTPGWHAPTGKLLAIGVMVRYNKKGRQISDVKRYSQTNYAVYDPKTDVWSKWKMLELPADAKFDFARNGCAQWIVEKDGTLLLPIYFGKKPCSCTVLKCSFDGDEMKYIEHGSELSLNVVRGLAEPSIAKFQDRYYLTLRNDLKGYVTVSDDGLHYRPIKPWTFDDGEELGSYNTQQHWIHNSRGLFLVYTRRGADNDHIFRHRAPLFIAQVDPQRLCVIRESEKIVVPERGAPLGNFGANPAGDRESWVIVAEIMRSSKTNPRGADSSVYLGRVIWTDPIE